MDMVKRRLLEETELQTELENLNGWQVVKGKLQKKFQFNSFVEAFGFMTSVALISEAMNHHPDWSNVYDTVTIGLVTHDLGGIGTFDVELAKKIQQVYDRVQGS
jgi:4a-hydroxytetrahydrobiopterin dehydratase